MMMKYSAKKSQAKRFRRRRRRESGQGMTEYILIVAFCLLALLGVMGVFLDNVGAFYQNVIYVVSLPFP